MSRKITPAQAEQALRRFAKEADQAIAQAHLPASEKTVQLARGRLSAQPVPDRPNVIGRNVGGGSGGVVLKYSTYPWAAGAEFGAIRWPQFNSYVGDRFTATPGDGYMIGDAIGVGIREIEDTYADAAERRLEALL